MAFTYGFFNSVAGDRKYNAEQMSEIFDGILKDGIIPSIGQIFAVETANNGMQINVGTGRAWFDHTWSKNDAIMVLTVPKSDITRPRYDAVVLEINHERNVRANSIKIVKGEPLVNPVKPTLVNSDLVHQYPLAYILVRPATDNINASDIENMVGRSPTVFATGILETVSIDRLWSQWEGEFTEWFEGVKLILSDDVVSNLQYQIDQLNAKVPGKATTTEAIAGSNNTKYVTPYTAKALVDAEKNAIKNQDGIEYGVATQGVVTVAQLSSADLSNSNCIRWYRGSYDIAYIDQNHFYLGTDYASAVTHSAVIDVGDYIVGSWSYSNSSPTGFHIIHKETMTVYRSPSWSNSSYYHFLAKAGNNGVYLVQNNTLYYGSVSRTGISRTNLANVENDGVVFANENYLVILSQSGSYIITVTIGSNAVRKFTLPSDFTVSSTLCAFVGSYILSYSSNGSGIISYTRINVTSGSTMTSSFTVAQSGALNVIRVYSDRIKNVAIILCSGGSSASYIVLADENGLITKKEVYGNLSTQNDYIFRHNEDESELVNMKAIIKYTTTTISFSSLSFNISDSFCTMFCAVPYKGYIAGIGPTISNRYYLMLFDKSFSNAKPITTPSFMFNGGEGSGSFISEASFILGFRENNSYNLLVSTRKGYLNREEEQFSFGIYHKLTVDTHPLVTIKSS